MTKGTTKTFDEIQIGDQASTMRTLTAKEIELYASAAHDYNPTHFDAAAAENTIGQSKILGHGMWIGVLLSHVFGNDLPGPGAVYRSQSLNWHRMTHLGDRITLTVTATGKDPATKIVYFDCECVDQNGELVANGKAEVYAPTKKIAAANIELKEARLLNVLDLFDDIVARAQLLDPVRVAVAHPTDAVSLGGAVEGAELGFMEPILFGPEKQIRAVAEENNIDISPYELVHCNHELSSAEKAVLACREGNADALMKGALHTDELMGAVVARATGLRTARRISHVFVMDVPAYHKMLLITDAAINIYPDLATKADIVNNAVEIAQTLGVQIPKVAVLSAVETVYPKIESTIEAAALCKMADRGQIKDVIIDGPLAYDNAISAEAARIKKIKSPVSGDVDILVAPNLEAGNMISKQLAYLANAEMAGIVLGARVPIILTSRADNARARLASAAIAALHAHRLKNL
ncbi:MAG: bifunctional enoyl-CoA hydratase/phosphate acetyltransferase [Alphaproteobacteria bacterium]